VSDDGTVDAALRRARRLGVDRLDAQLLIAHLLGQVRTWVMAHGEAAIDDQAIGRLLARRAAGEPLAYLVGEREFHGLRLHVTPDVLVPRSDTETLVDWALELLERRTAARVVDLGTGSGAVALAIKRACPHAQVHAVDRSTSALAVAQDNARRLGLDVTWHAGHWWSALPAGLRFDLALSNPPYVAPGDPHLDGLAHEPREALVPEADRGDGLADIERLCAAARHRLLRGAWMLLEHSEGQAVAVRQRLQSIGLLDICTRDDLSGCPRVTGGRWPG
jgi:release factor glutamine methyltransferase